MSVGEVQDEVDHMSEGQKYHLLKHHCNPSTKLPSRKVQGPYRRRFQPEWLQSYPWLRYSIKVDGVYCIYCCLFVSPEQRKLCGTLVNKPFIKWNKKSEKIHPHGLIQYHQDAEKLALNFISSVENPSKSIGPLIDRQRLEKIEKNRHIVPCTAEAILFCGRQCIGLRGDCEKFNSSGNPGNFLALLSVMAQHDEKLKEGLQNPTHKNATYLSPQTQNEVIDVIGIHMIQKALVQEIQESDFFAVMADEVSSHNTEQMPICIRFVDKNHDIREEFLQFVQLKSLTGKGIGQEIVKSMEQLGLDIGLCRGQGYDGASNMSSERVGTQAYIKERSPLAVYVHCSSHKLNLVISHSCGVPEIKFMCDKLASVFIYFDCPKKSELLEAITNVEHPPGSKRKPLINMCKTRWAERHDAASHFYTSYLYIVKAFEVIALGLHQNDYDPDYTKSKWIPKAKTEAYSLLGAISNFKFIVAFLTIYHMLSHLEGVTVQLQKSSIDILQAYLMVCTIFQEQIFVSD